MASADDGGMGRLEDSEVRQGAAKVRAPVDDLGLPAVEADHQAGAGGTEVEGFHKMLSF